MQPALVASACTDSLAGRLNKHSTLSNRSSPSRSCTLHPLPCLAMARTHRQMRVKKLGGTIVKDYGAQTFPE